MRQSAALRCSPREASRGTADTGRCGGSFSNACLLGVLLLVASAAAHAEIIFADSFELPGPCEGAVPAGFTVVERGWNETWGGLCPGSPTYPNSLPFPVPLQGQPQVLVVTVWTPGPDESAHIYWDGAQPNVAACYAQPRPAESMYVSISQCRGDTRPRGACGRFGQENGIIWSTELTGSNICTLTPGVPAYMTITPHNPDTLESSCGVTFPDGCDVQARHTGL